MSSVDKDWRSDLDEGWQWQSCEAEPQGRISKRPVIAITLLSLAWFALPAGAARQLDDSTRLPATTLFGWTRSSTGDTPAPLYSLIEMAQKEGDAVVPPVKRQPPKTPAATEPPAPQVQPDQPQERVNAGQAAEPKPSTKSAAQDQAAPSSGSGSNFGLGSILAPLTEWLAKANREYQGTIVKELSKPSPEQMEAEARRLAEEKAAREREEAAKAEAAEKAALAAAEAKKRAAAEAAAKDAEAKKQAEAAKEEVKKPAEAKPATATEAEAARAAEDKRIAEEKRLAEQKREEQARKAQAEADRKAREAKAAEERQAREAKLAEERRAKAAAEEAAARERPAAQPSPAATASGTERHRRWTVTIIPEPIERPSSRSAPGGSVRAAEATGVLVGTGRMSLGAGSLKGTAVKRWVWREGTCRFAGRKLQKRYTVARGDSLWRISEKYYDQGAKYPRIYKANRDRINDPDMIYPCQKFRVPKR